LRGPRPRPLDDGAMWPEKQKNRAYYIGKVNRRATKNQDEPESTSSPTLQSGRHQTIDSRPLLYPQNSDGVGHPFSHEI
jgi:hypothetical protein